MTIGVRTQENGIPCLEGSAVQDAVHNGADVGHGPYFGDRVLVLFLSEVSSRGATEHIPPTVDLRRTSQRRLRWRAINSRKSEPGVMLDV